MLRRGWFRLQKIQCDGSFSWYTRYSTPFCSMYAVTRRTPCGFASCTLTGVETPICRITGLTVSVVPVDNTTSAIAIPTIKQTNTTTVFTFSHKN